MADSKPKNIAVALFPGFQLLDITGPLDALNLLSNTYTLNLSILAPTLQPVSTKHDQAENKVSNFSQSIVPTHTYENAPDDVEVLIIPGGKGTRIDDNVQGVVDYVKRVYPRLKYLLTVCTGSLILAKTGILDGRKATSNKRAFNYVKEQRPQVEWVAQARWVVDGNIWTSSGISAGMDLTYAWIESIWGKAIADDIADTSEYERSRDAGVDRFAERWGLV